MIAFLALTANQQLQLDSILSAEAPLQFEPDWLDSVGLPDVLPKLPSSPILHLIPLSVA